MRQSLAHSLPLLSRFFQLIWAGMDGWAYVMGLAHGLQGSQAGVEAYLTAAGQKSGATNGAANGVANGGAR